MYSQFKLTLLSSSFCKGSNKSDVCTAVANNASYPSNSSENKTLLS